MASKKGQPSPPTKIKYGLRRLARGFVHTETPYVAGVHTLYPRESDILRHIYFLLPLHYYIPTTDLKKIEQTLA